MTNTSARVAAVSLSAAHGFSKQPQRSVHLLAGQGVEGDAHCGATTQHLYRMKLDASEPNLCQVHLLSEELLADLAAHGYTLTAGELGENVLTRGLDLLTLPLGTMLRVGEEAVLEVTGLRTPCRQIDGFRPGLQQHCWGPRAADGERPRRVGIMSIVVRGGAVKPGDAVAVELPPLPHLALPAV